MAKPWPPPPDLESLKELFANADVERLIADDCPLDEYDPEAKHFFEAIAGYPTAKLTVENLLPLLEDLWAKQFMLQEPEIAQRRDSLRGLAEQVARFFGPGAQPKVRGS